MTGACTGARTVSVALGIWADADPLALLGAAAPVRP
jgi:hypothetical protein